MKKVNKWRLKLRLGGHFPIHVSGKELRLGHAFKAPPG
jgi:hypothetical protein